MNGFKPFSNYFGWEGLPGHSVTRGPGWEMHDFSGGEYLTVLKPPSRPKPPPIFKPITFPTPNQKQVEISQRIFMNRAREEARRLAEQARQRERAAREARERAIRERQLEEERKRLREHIEQQQKELQLRLQKERERIRQQRDIEERRRVQQNAQRSTFLGTMLAGMIQPGLRAYAIRRPPDFLNVQGPELVIKEAVRTGALVNLGMENFSFWVNQAASVIAGIIGMPAEYMATVGMTKAVQAITRRVNKEVLSSATKLSGTLGRTATSSAPKSIDRVFMECRNEAHRIAVKLVKQCEKGGKTVTKQRFGEIVDALFKSLVQQARSDGLVPKTIRTAPPPLAISGTRLPIGGAVDVWDSATGIGWDVTKATVSNVAKHESYINRVMEDGTKIIDVRPLVYPR